jgi:hypothetical protein
MSSDKNLLKEPQQHYQLDPAEINQLKAGLQRSYLERFKMMTTLMKMNIMLSKAKITHAPSSKAS